VYVDIHDEHAGADDRRITGAIDDDAPSRHDPGRRLGTARGMSREGDASRDGRVRR
jgi:hypothetical protein